MERLTKRIDFGNGTHTVDFSNERCGEFLTDHKAGVKALFDKLAEYEDLEEQGLLIRLPCKVGDDVWTIMCGMTGKHPALFRQEFTLSMFSHFGTAVFLTKEEAEAALAEMER